MPPARKKIYRPVADCEIGLVNLAGAKTVVDVRLPARGKIPMVNSTGCRAQSIRAVQVVLRLV